MLMNHTVLSLTETFANIVKKLETVVISTYFLM